MNRKKLGYIVNPKAGIGGSVGLKGSDGLTIQRKAIELGAEPQAGSRGVDALKMVKNSIKEVEIITYPAEMGAESALAAEYNPTIIGEIAAGNTTPNDTKQAAREMIKREVDLILFSGGDGTARDIYDVVGVSLPVVGIPAGVKIQSAVFAINPRAAGDLTADFLTGKIKRFKEAEVMDIDERGLQAGVISARLYGYLKVPVQMRLLQNQKQANPASERGSMKGIAANLVDRMAPNTFYILGPGTTTRAVAEVLDVPKTLVGVDVLEVVDGERKEGKLVAVDVNERELLAILEEHQAKIIVTPIGGQGFLFGRGNQQLSYRVIRQVGRENIIIISTKEKLAGLAGRPLLVDTGDFETDMMLSGHMRIVTGYEDFVIYKVSN